MGTGEYEQGLDQILELGSTVIKQFYEKEIKRANAEKAGMQEQVFGLVNLLLNIKRHSDFLPPIVVRSVIQLTLSYETIRNRQRLSTLIIEEYDEFSEYTENIEAGINTLNEQYAHMMTQYTRMVGEELTNRHFSPLHTDLEELIAVYRQTIDTIDNQIRSLLEFWEFLYPKKEFPRDTSALYDDSTMI